MQRGTACEDANEQPAWDGEEGFRLYIPPSPEESNAAGCSKLACVLLKGSAAQPLAARPSRLEEEDAAPRVEEEDAASHVEEDDAAELLALDSVGGSSRAGSGSLPRPVLTGMTPAAMAAARTCRHGRPRFR